ncbi:MAG: hypothetical protein H0X25_06620 [Acidobacteriales bacterium]|nr:hypothetical protein [Terriglobales bacterium]
MPILLMALMALAIFGLIGILLFTASLMEQRTENAHKPSEHHAAQPAVHH